jgi:hypothetical protein
VLWNKRVLDAGNHIYCMTRKNMRNYIKYNVTFNLRKPEGGTPPHCQDTLLKTRGLTRGVVRRVSINTDLFILNF